MDKTFLRMDDSFLIFWTIVKIITGRKKAADNEAYCRENIKIKPISRVTADVLDWNVSLNDFIVPIPKDEEDYRIRLLFPRTK